MLTPSENERLTRVGADTPMGRTWRRYWVPAALSSELTERDGPPVRVRLLGEDLITFRDSEGHAGLVDAYCPHRRAPLFFGRNEERGLRCVYHGWKFDRRGTCVDMPSEPPDSLFKQKVQLRSYPTWEGGGLIWAYLGPPDTMPAPPDYEFVRAPATHRFVSKTEEHCNWLQTLEGGLDTAHASFLHNQTIHDVTLHTADTAPRLDVEKTDYGFRYAAIRTSGQDQYVRVCHYLMPAQQCRPRVVDPKGGTAAIPTIHGHIWVPADDTHTHNYNWAYSYDPAIPIPLDHAEEYEARSGRGVDDYVPGTFRLKKALDNDYLIDRQLQRQQTFTGIVGFNTQDFAVQEGMGPIVDRSLEHLGTTDRAIIAIRQLLLEATHAVERGDRPRGAASVLCRTIRAVDRIIPRAADWREALREESLAKF